MNTDDQRPDDSLQQMNGRRAYLRMIMECPPDHEIKLVHTRLGQLRMVPVKKSPTVRFSDPWEKTYENTSAT